MSFYDTYVQLCNSIGKSPSAVAKEIGIEKSTVTHWSKGGNPSFSTRIKIANYFHLPITYFDNTDIICLSTENQNTLLSSIYSALDRVGMSFSQAQISAGVSSDFSRLERLAYSQASKRDIITFLTFLNISPDSFTFLNTPARKLPLSQLSAEEENVLLALRLMSPQRRDIFFSVIQNPSLSYLDTKLFENYCSLNSTGRDFIQQSVAMAMNSYSEKNNAVSDMEEAN